jgi:hypothetical protein
MRVRTAGLTNGVAGSAASGMSVVLTSAVSDI